MSEFVYLQTIADLLKLFQPGENLHHPLITIIDFSKVKGHVGDGTKISADFYCIMFKTYANNYVKYGRKNIDFQDGSLICMAPNQVIEMDSEIETADSMSGWGLFFHPDLIRGTSLGDKMKEYNFFSYEISEALHLSEKEKQILYDCVLKIEAELRENIDIYSQHIIVSTLELLLSYCIRFYGRQFITRKSSNNAVVAQIETMLNEYFKKNDIHERGLPTVKYLAEQVHLSPSYLSDLLKKETGKNTQDHIHFYLIEEAKNILLSTNKSVSEIAYSLGFEYPQYFNKLFKQKTGKTPVKFRTMN
ncbi:helix-turn-helix domain-containing protein [Chitinophaga pinensis]|uniref:Transcriptional regulator, AraC family n=1 Tax=Chitinophaga pinensis (strain ATCC 43595 / DSM 2588 / LMG 13176 / NBRC 15968 / NCIMB 11800 / UQM 2034) TaxID=485918 RepID=A0A979GAT6_CHIPD|nr:helix-turn-helix transcriptional regulator [Chitinophaga pinensis]ACU64104.1 transcriptional regulator, AraC family [Chitinophaga pinensis DSM 2588]